MKGITLLILLLVLLAVLPSGLTYAVQNDVEYFDDFESYNAVNLSGTNKMISDKWRSNNRMGYDSAAEFGITSNVTGNDSNVLYIQAKAALTDYGNYPGAIYVGDQSLFGTNRKITFDMYSPDYRIHNGIRFMVHNDQNNYYELFFQSGMAWSVVKSVSGTRTRIENKAGTTLPVGKWYRVELYFYNGEISWNVYSKSDMQRLDTYCGSVFDSSPFTVSGNSAAAQFVSAGFQGFRGYFDNFAMSDFDPFMSGNQPSNVIYKGICIFEKTENLYDFGCMQRIRKIKLSEVQSTNIRIFASTDGLLFDLIFEGDVGIPEATVINSDYTGSYRYVRIEGDYKDAVFMNNIEAILYMPIKSSTVFYPRIEGGDLDGESVTWQSEDNGIFTVNNGLIFTNAKGISRLTVSYGSASLSFTVNVIGEMEYALEYGGEEAYVSKKRIVTDAVNSAIKSSDSELLELVFSFGTDQSISNIYDFDFEVISDLEPESLSRLITILLDYQLLYTENENITIEHFRDFIGMIHAEISVFEMDNLETAGQVEEAILKNNFYYALDINSELFVEYKNQIYASMTQKEFNGLADLRKHVLDKQFYYKSEYVLNKFNLLINYLYATSFLEEFSDVIGYDIEKYNAISDKEAFSIDFMNEKMSMKTLEDIRHYINSYIPPKTSNTGSGAGIGTGSSGSSSTSLKIHPSLEQEFKETKPVSVFKDIELSHWAYYDILFLSARKIISGYEDGNIKPNSNITRAEFIKMILAAFSIKVTDETDAENGSLFSDIKVGDWYYPYMATAGRDSIILGDGDNLCYPEKNITRQEMCVVIYRIIKQKGIKLQAVEGPIAFTDANDIQDWALHAVMQLQSFGIISGTPELAFLPLSNATRAETSKILTAIIRKVESGEENNV